MFWKRLRSFFIPSPGPLVLVWAALAAFVLLGLSTLVIARSTPDLGNGVATMSAVAFPAAAFLLGIAALVERRPGGRFLLALCSFGVLVLAIPVLLLGARPGDVIDFNNALVLLCCPCGPVYLVMVMALMFLGQRARSPFRRALRAARMQRLIGMVEARGEVTLPEMGRELSLKETEVAELVKELINDGELMAVLDPQHQCVYSAAALNEKQRRLQAMVETQGKTRLSDLAGELQVTQSMVRQWVHALVQRGRLHGFADWTEGWIYSREAGHLAGQDRCPNCGGQQDMAGKGVIQCQHCGVEVFQ
jgi:predicted DNA-binding transcriptional regulator